MKPHLRVTTLLLLIFFLAQGCQESYTYETVPGDPLEARIYTLDNGLKVYLSVYDEEPRIQTYVAVRAGSKNDPAETTGLAHYFEHLMFKGTSNFGTANWEEEKPLLDEIQRLFEIYRVETDDAKRAAIYHQIDSISYIASTLAIPNEYDRLMSAIGSTGTNAGTSNDYTIYMENIPSNQLEQWALIQAERFNDPVLRLFHTELETVYEEKNMSLTNDGRQASEALLNGLFPRHPYGLQTTLGEAEHLKNPSLINIRNFFDQYYIPNNMAVVMSGDFDPDEAIRLIDEHFGKLEPKELKEFTHEEQPPITAPIVKEVTGLQAENIQMGWRFEGASSSQSPYLDMISMILSNGRAGLIDQNLNKPMAVLGAGAYARTMSDYSVLTLSGRNKNGQSLDEVKDLLMQQLELLKNGDFPEWIMEAAINNLKLQEMRRLENTSGRAMAMAMSFLSRVPYEQTVNYLDVLNNITREDIIAFANEHIRDDNYVVVYKRQDQPQDTEQVQKPAITPIHINRDAESPFLTQIKNTQVPEIEPVFLNFEKDITRAKTAQNLEILYANNTANPTFSVTYFWRKGSYHDKYLPLAGSFMNYLGTDQLSAEEISNEFYKLASSYNVSVRDDETRITISGLSENMTQTLELFENLIWNAQADQPALDRFVDNIQKSREDSKSNQQANFSALVNYAIYGPENPSRYTLTNEELDALTADHMITTLQQMWNDEHQVIFYGPQQVSEVVAMVEDLHKVPAQLNAIPQGLTFEPQETTQNKVYFAHYDAKQSYLQTVSKGMVYNEELVPLITMYNSYFGGGMNAIVFQEMREKRGLAYTARSSYSSPSNPDENYINNSFIATQNDKVVDAFSAFNELFNDMPHSQTSFSLAQDQLFSNLRTQRVRDTGIIWSYLAAEKMGRDYDIRKVYYEQIPNITMDQVLEFNQQYIKGQPKTYVILGNENMVNFDELEKLFGPVTRLSQEDLFVF
ncbi:MAG: insulinase family protein [Bacteroidales bacterium]